MRNDEERMGADEGMKGRWMRRRKGRPRSKWTAQERANPKGNQMDEEEKGENGMAEVKGSWGVVEEEEEGRG